MLSSFTRASRAFWRYWRDEFTTHSLWLNHRGFRNRFFRGIVCLPVTLIRVTLYWLREIHCIVSSGLQTLIARLEPAPLSLTQRHRLSWWRKILGVLQEAPAILLAMTLHLLQGVSSVALLMKKRSSSLSGFFFTLGLMVLWEVKYLEWVLPLATNLANTLAGTSLLLTVFWNALAVIIIAIFYVCAFFTCTGLEIGRASTFHPSDRTVNIFLNLCHYVISAALIYAAYITAPVLGLLHAWWLLEPLFLANPAVSHQEVTEEDYQNIFQWLTIKQKMRQLKSYLQFPANQDAANATGAIIDKWFSLGNIEARHIILHEMQQIKIPEAFWTDENKKRFFHHRSNSELADGLSKVLQTGEVASMRHFFVSTYLLQKFPAVPEIIDEQLMMRSMNLLLETLAPTYLSQVFHAAKPATLRRILANLTHLFAGDHIDHAWFLNANVHAFRRNYARMRQLLNAAHPLQPTFNRLLTSPLLQNEAEWQIDDPQSVHRKDRHVAEYLKRARHHFGAVTEKMGQEAQLFLEQKLTAIEQNPISSPDAKSNDNFKAFLAGYTVISTGLTVKPVAEAQNLLAILREPGFFKGRYYQGLDSQGGFYGYEMLYYLKEMLFNKTLCANATWSHEQHLFHAHFTLVDLFARCMRQYNLDKSGQLGATHDDGKASHPACNPGKPTFLFYDAETFCKPFGAPRAEEPSLVQANDALTEATIPFHITARLKEIYTNFFLDLSTQDNYPLKTRNTLLNILKKPAGMPFLETAEERALFKQLLTAANECFLRYFPLQDATEAHLHVVRKTITELCHLKQAEPLLVYIIQGWLAHGLKTQHPTLLQKLTDTIWENFRHHAEAEDSPTEFAKPLIEQALVDFQYNGIKLTWSDLENGTYTSLENSAVHYFEEHFGDVPFPSVPVANLATWQAMALLLYRFQEENIWLAADHLTLMRDKKCIEALQALYRNLGNADAEAMSAIAAYQEVLVRYREENNTDKNYPRTPLRMDKDLRSLTQELSAPRAEAAISRAIKTHYPVASGLVIPITAHSTASLTRVATPAPR